MNNMKYRWISALCLCLITLMASAYAMTDMNDKPANIQTLVGKGKWTVVEVWASDCRMCQLSIQHMVNFKTAHPEVNVVGISVDGTQGKVDAKAFIEEQHLTFTNLLSDRMEMDQYLFANAEKNFIGTPTFLFYDPQGKLLTVQAKALTEKELGRFMDSQSPPPEIAEPC